MKRSKILQRLTNEYPGWSDVRQDLQSVGAQLLNVCSNKIEDLYEQIIRVGNNYFISTASLKDPDVIYHFDLPKTTQFTVIGGTVEQPLYLPPTVTGVDNGTTYSISLATDNDLESFWYESTPTRIVFSNQTTISNAITDMIDVVRPGLVFKKTISEFPYEIPIDIEYPYPKLWVETYGGDQYFDSSVGTVTITGITSKGLRESETIKFVHDDMKQTIKSWRQIIRIDVENIAPESATVRIFTHRFGRLCYPKVQPERDFYNLQASSDSGEGIDTFWSVDLNGVTNSVVLQEKTWEVDNLQGRMAGLVGIQVLNEFELLSATDTPLTDVIDMAIQPYTNKIWVLTAAGLYLFDNNLLIPNLGKAKLKNSNCMSVIEAEKTQLVYGQAAVLSYIWRRPIIDIDRFRIFVEAPNGTKYSLSNSTLVQLNNNWSYGTLTDRLLKAQDIVPLDQRGEWIFSLEVVYSDGTKEIDQRIITVASKVALCHIPLTFPPTTTIIGIDFSSYEDMWLATVDNGIYSKSKVNFRYDVMMIDYDSKVIYFKDKYSEVQVTI